MGDEPPALLDWRETMQPRLMRLQAFEMPTGFELDFSPESLDALEARLLSSPRRESFIDAATGYLGEALMTTAGGRWAWDDESDNPVIQFDPSLRLAPMAPDTLLLTAVEGGTGHTFVQIQRELREAVEARQAAVPGWRPAKELTPGLDEIFATSGADFLERWRPEREQDFPRWVAEYGSSGGQWDFSPESLDLLEQMVRQRLDSKADADRPEQQDFLAGAGWYLGEVLRREGHAEWTYTEGEIDPRNADLMYVGRPYVRQKIHNGQSIVPCYAFRNLLQAPPGFLRERLSWFHDSYRRAEARARRS